MATEKYTFYHGTSAASARSILINGARQDYLKSIGAEILAVKVAQHIFSKINVKSYQTLVDPYWEVSEALRIRFGINVIGKSGHDLWVRSLPHLFDTQNKSLFEYGGFFVTASITRAYRYACSNPYGSEFIHSLVGGIEILKLIDASISEDIAKTISESADLFAAMSRRSNPVVIEMSGINVENFISESGSNDISNDLRILDFFESIGHDPQVSFQLSKLDRAKITAIHDLKDWNSELDPTLENTQEFKINKNDWLENS